MNDPLIENIESVFSILPAELAREAQADTIARINDPGELGAKEIKWAEFDAIGAFLRGGVTDLSGLTRLVSSVDGDPVLTALAEAAASGATAGTIVTLAPHDVLFWFIPVAPRLGSKWTHARVKGLAINLSVFSQLGEIRDTKIHLTPAEKRVLFQVTAGTSMRATAIADKVSIETKRTQIKSLCTKLDCSSKHELTRYATGQMMQLVALCDTDMPESAPTEQFAERYLSEDVRLVFQRLPNGRLLRCFEIGPPTGTPLLVIHGMLFPALIIGARSYLVAAGIRLIMPLRHGYLDARPLGDLLQDDDLMAQSLDDIALFARTTFSGSVAVLGHSYGAPISIRFASKYPDLVTQIILLSINAGTLHQETHRFTHRFYTSLQRLLHRPGLFRVLAWQFRKAYADIRTVGPILRKLYGGCEDDLAALEGESGADSFHLWFAECYQTSIAGISADFQFVLQDWRSDLAVLTVPISVIHGDDDPIIGAEQLATFAASMGVDYVTWIEGGHLICATKQSAVWSAVTENVASSPNATVASTDT